MRPKPAVFMLSLALLAAQPAQARELRSSDAFNGAYPTIDAIGYMADVLKEKTGGNLTISVGEGDSETELFNIGQVRQGTQDMARINVSVLNGLAPSTKVLSLPFLFRSDDHLRRVLDGPVGAGILRNLEAHGLIGLCFLEVGSRSVISDSKPIRIPGDLKGMRVVIQDASVFAPTMWRLGAVPVGLPPNRVAVSMEKKIVDAVTGNWLTLVSTPGLLKAKYMNLTEHTRPPGVVVFSMRTWDTLNTGERESLRGACRAAQLRLRQEWNAKEAAARKSALENGVVEVGDVDRRAFETLLAPRYQELLGDPLLMESVRRVQETE